MHTLNPYGYESKLCPLVVNQLLVVLVGQVQLAAETLAVTCRASMLAAASLSRAWSKSLPSDQSESQPYLALDIGCVPKAAFCVWRASWPLDCRRCV